MKEKVSCSKCGSCYERRKSATKIRNQHCPSCKVSLSNIKRDVSGPNNPMWRGGHASWQAGKTSYDKDGLHWDEQRRIALERDNYSCQACGKSRETEGPTWEPDVHHDPPYRIDPSHAAAKLQCLCPSCHHRADSLIKQYGEGLNLSDYMKSKATKPRCKHCSHPRRKIVTEGSCKPCLIEKLVPVFQSLKANGSSYREIAKQYGYTNYQNIYSLIVRFGNSKLPGYPKRQ